MSPLHLSSILPVSSSGFVVAIIYYDQLLSEPHIVYIDKTSVVYYYSD